MTLHDIHPSAAAGRARLPASPPAAPAAESPGAGDSPVVARAVTADTPLAKTLARAVQERATGTGPLLARMPGLPTKKQAQQEGGKAGFHLGRGKTTYGQILDALSLFRKLPSHDKATAAQLLLRIQALIDAWHASGHRDLTSAGDRRKRAFLGKLKPKIKQLYFEVATKAAVFDPIQANAATHADANRARIAATLKTAGRKHDDTTIDTLLDKISSAPLTTNFPPEALDHYTFSPEFKNIWEIKYAGKNPKAVLGKPGSLGGVDQREDAERWLGYAPLTDADRPNRPHYTGININRNPKGAAPNYGRFYFEWKDSVKQRATFTARDTFAMRMDADVKDLPQAELIGTADHMEATLAFNEKTLVALAYEEEGDDDAAAALRKKNAFYIEAQVHGGLDARDAKALWVGYKQKNTDAIDMEDKARAEAFSARWGVPIRYYSG